MTEIESFKLIQLIKHDSHASPSQVPRSERSSNFSANAQLWWEIFGSKKLEPENCNTCFQAHVFRRKIHSSFAIPENALLEFFFNIY